MKHLIAPVLAIIFFVACDRKPVDIGIVDAYAPIYTSKELAQTITQLPAQPIVNGGKIATVGNFVFQVETNRGIHIIDYSNPANPVKKSFIQIAACQELTIKGNFIYTNNLADLVVLDFSILSNIKLSSRIENTFPDLVLQYPPQTGVYFECSDPSKGFVSGWELKKINNPKCHR